MNTALFLLDQVARRAFDFFWNEAHPKTGQVKDRAGNFQKDNYRIASIASTGFALAALPVGVERGWVKKEAASERAVRTLKFILNEMSSEHGWYYHFIDWETGKRQWDCELSSIDTILLVAGALAAGEYFKGSEVDTLANRLYQRIDFEWMLTDGGAKPNERLIGHGWKPESGFLTSRWGNYCEHNILYLLALGSPSTPIPAACWDAWRRDKVSYKGFETISGGPLFMHQMSHVYVDFKGLRDRPGYHYWVSSRNATLAQRQFCLDQAAKYRTYSGDVWGLTACDGPDGYRAYSAFGYTDHDGTVAPTAPITSIIFTPNESLAAMLAIHEKHQSRLWGRYGFSNAFNVDRDWWDKDVIGIDLGMMLLAIEDYRSRLIWQLFMGHLAVKNGMKAAGFSKTQEDDLTAPVQKTGR